MSTRHETEGSHEQRPKSNFAPNAPYLFYADIIARNGVNSEKARAFRKKYAHDPSFIRAAEVIETVMRTKAQAVHLTALDTDVPIARTGRSVPREVGEDFML